MLRKVTVFVCLLLCIFANTACASHEVDAYFFWGDGCVHCVREKSFLSELQKKYSNLNVHNFEVYHSKSNFIWLKKAAHIMNITNVGVPLLVIGDQYFTGYIEGNTDIAIVKKINECEENQCLDRLKNLFDEGLQDHLGLAQQIHSGFMNRDITIPFLGKTKITKSILPIFTIVMGILDGFNPCAMWVLVFLIGLLLDMKDKKKRWILGTVFIFVSGFVYYLFMAAWLNFILFLGVVIWIRLGIGIVALIVGGYSLKEFLFQEYTCKVTSSINRKKIFHNIRNIIYENNFILALLGISILAFTVNLVELACSAGLPATYMQILVLNNVPSWQHYLYILLYIFFFMLDDLLVFFIAMLTLEITGLTNNYTKYSKLVGGILMLVLGLLIIFKPRWLMFG